jgi:ribonuclease-3
VPEDLRRSGNVLAALMEAVLAALYLEYGLDTIAGPVVAVFAERIEEALTEDVDNKTALQEELAKRGQRVEYVTLETEGPPHNRTFHCAAVVDGEQVGIGTGRTKKDAEQEAAREALAQLVVLPS